MRDIEREHNDKLKKWAHEIVQELEERGLQNDALVDLIEERTGVRGFAGDVDPPTVFAHQNAYADVVFQLLQNACEVRVERPTTEELKAKYEDDELSEADDIPEEVWYRIWELGWILGPGYSIEMCRDWEGILVGVVSPTNEKVDGVYFYEDGDVAHSGTNLPPHYPTFEEMFEADELYRSSIEPDTSNVPVEPEQVIAEVARQARAHNAWEAVAVVESYGNPGSGYLAFRRDVFPFQGKGYGTAVWIEAEGDVLFEHGHYDLTRQEALADLANRSGLTQSTIISNVTAALGG
jgi:hypothetical protein